MKFRRFSSSIFGLSTALAVMTLGGCSTAKPKKPDVATQLPKPSEVDSSDPLITRARALLRSNKSADVVTMLASTLESSFPAEDALDLLFQAQLQLDLLEEAGGVLQIWEKAHPESARLKKSVGEFALVAGRIELQTGVLDAAASQFKIALEVLDPRGPVRGSIVALLQGRSAVYSENGSPEKSLKVLDMGLGLLPDEPEFLKSRGKVMVELGDVRGAQETYRRYLQIVPDDAEILARVQALSTMSQGAAGADGFESSPAETQVRRALGVLDHDRAQQLAESALAASPGDPSAVALLAEVLLARGRADEARRVLEPTIGSGDDFRRVIFLARILTQLGDFKGALERLAELETRPDLEEPARIEIRVEFGAALLAAREVESARRVFDRVIEQVPDHARAFFYLGRIHEARKDIGRAIADFERAALVSRSDPTRAETLFRLALAYQQGGRRQDHLRTLERLAIEHSVTTEGRKARQILGENLPQPPPPDALGLADGVTAYRAGALEQSERIFRKALDAPTSEGDRASALVGLAKLHLVRGEYREAASLFNEAVSLNPKGLDGLLGLGEALYAQGLWGEAAEAFRRIDLKGYEGARIKFWLGRCLENVDLIEGALLSYEEGAHLAMDSPGGEACRDRLERVEKLLVGGFSTYESSSPVRAGAGFPEETAGPVFRNEGLIGEVPAGQPSPDTPVGLDAPLPPVEVDRSTLLRNVEALVRRGRGEEALDLYHRALQSSPQDVTLHLEMADLLKTTGRNAESLQVVLQAVELDPDREDVHLELARAYFRMDRREEAVVSFQRALQINPDNERTIFALADLLHAGNRFDEERVILEILLQKNLPAPVREQAQRLYNRVSQQTGEAIGSRAP